MDAADNLLQNKLVQHKITPRKTTYLACPSSSRGRDRIPEEPVPRPAIARHVLSPTRPAPPPPPPGVPRSHHQGQDENMRRHNAENGDDDGLQDPASRLWARIRRASGLSIKQRRRNTSTSTTASVAASVSLPFSTACIADNRALRRRKACINEGSSLLMQRQHLAAMGSTTSLTDRTNLNTMEDALMANQCGSPKEGGKPRRASGRAGFFGGWFV